MSYESAQPRMTLEFAGKSYDVTATFALIDQIEWALKDNIINVTMRALDLPTRDMAKIIACMINSTGEKMTEAQAGEKIFELGIASSEYAALSIQILALLRIALVKPSEREATKDEMGKLMGKLKEASLGANTEKSA